MKCYYHENREAVATCNVCGKALCPECADKYNVPLCGNCASTEVTEEKNRIKRNMMIGGGLIVAFIVWNIIMGGIPISSSMSIGTILELISVPFILVCAPFGWGALNRITANTFMILPLIGWLLYPIVKAMLSLYVGLVAAPVAVIKYLKLKSNIESVEMSR